MSTSVPGRFPIAAVVAALTAGAAAAQRPQPAFHFKPADSVLGDVHPYYVNGECYLYYLTPNPFNSRLVKSRDLIRWTPVRLTHDPVLPGDWFAPYFVIGIVQDRKAGVFRSFYELPNSRGRVVSSESRDLLHWQPGPKALSIPPGNYYKRRSDPYVFWDPDAKEYGCVIGTQMRGEPENQMGAFSLTTSPDLNKWSPAKVVLNPGNISRPECPQMFQIGKYWYLLASLNSGNVGRPTYWQAERPTGPWDPRPTGHLDGRDLCAAQVAHDGERTVLFGWIPLQPILPGGKQHWGGSLALPREVFALEDGTLGTRLHPDVAQKIATRPVFTADGFPTTAQPATLAGFWDHFQFETTVTVPRACEEWKLSLAPLGEVTLNRTTRRLTIADATGQVRRDLPVAMPVNHPLPLKVIVTGDVVEVFFRDRYSLAGRLPKAAGPVRIGVVATGADVPLGPIQVSRLRLN